MTDKGKEAKIWITLARRCISSDLIASNVDLRFHVLNCVNSDDLQEAIIAMHKIHELLCEMPELTCEILGYPSFIQSIQKLILNLSPKSSHFEALLTLA